MFQIYFNFLLKLSYPIEKLFLLPAGFELRTLLLVSDADTLTTWAIAHSECSNNYLNFVTEQLILCYLIKYIDEALHSHFNIRVNFASDELNCSYRLLLVSIEITFHNKLLKTLIIGKLRNNLYQNCLYWTFQGSGDHSFLNRKESHLSSHWILDTIVRRFSTAVGPLNYYYNFFFQT